MTLRPLLARLATALLILPSGCASLSGATTEPIGDHRVEYVVARHARGTVVFENGLGGTFDWWAKVFPAIAQDTTAFAYNRPGYGRSDPVATPRDGAHVVDALRALLRHAGLEPPYVLVGHSLGGLYMQYYARRYPDEVRALILVDSTHPAQLQGAGARENWPAWARVAFDLTTSDTAQAELTAVNATGEALLKLPPPRDMPVIILSAAQPLRESSPLADDANAKRKDLARLYPGARQIWVDSGHAIPLEKPEAVIAAIRASLPAEP